MSDHEGREITAADWRERANVDREDARLILANRREHLENVAFHCQQSVEKLVKAFLVAHGVAFPKIHDVARLLDEFVAEVDDNLARQADFARNLNVYAVAARYPEFEETIDTETAQMLIELMDRAWALFEPRIAEVLEAREVAEDAGEPEADEPDPDA